MTVGQFLVRATIALVVVTALRQVAVHLTSERNIQVLETLSAGADDINQRAPIQMDNDLRLDRALAGPGKKMTYFYSFTKLDGQEMPDQIITDFMKKLEKSLLDEYNTATDMQGMKANEVDMVYSYHDRHGRHLFDIQVGPHH